MANLRVGEGEAEAEAEAEDGDDYYSYIRSKQKANELNF